MSVRKMILVPEGSSSQTTKLGQAGRGLIEKPITTYGQLKSEEKFSSVAQLMHKLENSGVIDQDLTLILPNGEQEYNTNVPKMCQLATKSTKSADVLKNPAKSINFIDALFRSGVKPEELVNPTIKRRLKGMYNNAKRGQVKRSKSKRQYEQLSSSDSEAEEKEINKFKKPAFKWASF